ncbi:hypothetical protein MAR_003204 [Mya arenaria]|uniref:Uncharacterized protein n=1 Tax=Mya arenaria TaxID=6604 RepID=A0ABY7GEL2_MYAAR|nr:hypothetical protein MAR_003204 [Mya arenaria]
MEQSLMEEQALKCVNGIRETEQINNLKPNEILQVLEEFKELKVTVAGLRDEKEVMEVKINNLTENLKACDGKIGYLFKVIENKGNKTCQEAGAIGRFVNFWRKNSEPSVCHSKNEHQSVFEKFRDKFGLQDVRNHDSDPEVIFVLRTSSIRVEDEATAAVADYSEDQCSRVVLVLFYRTHQPISKINGGKASYYQHPSIQKTFHIVYHENDERSKCILI